LGGRRLDTSEDKTAESFYTFLENEIVPEFYNAKDTWLARMKKNHFHRRNRFRHRQNARRLSQENVFVLIWLSTTDLCYNLTDESIQALK